MPAYRSRPIPFRPHDNQCQCPLRVTIKRKLFNSALLGAMRVTRLPTSNFAQLIRIFYHRELGFAQYFHQKWILGRALAVQFRGRVNGWIDFAPEDFTGLP